MQWCVHIAGPQDLDGDATVARFTSLEGSARLESAVRLAAGQIVERFGQVRFTRCAFGNEFCEHLLPAPSALAAAVEAARARDLAFTLVTPYVSNEGIRKLAELLPLLPEGTEVVFNDWGVLNLMLRKFAQLRPVQGRLLNKSLRDPRVMGIYGEAPAADGAAAATLAALQRSNLDNESSTALLSRFGVAAVEMDNLPQGMDLSFAARLPVAVYLPFGFISTSRVCMAAGLHYHKADKFQPGAPCRHECQTHLVEYTYTNSPFTNRDQKFYLKGNTYFYTHSEPMLRSLLDHAASGRVARLIFQPRLPMTASVNGVS